jgi:hypothetical protein
VEGGLPFPEASNACWATSEIVLLPERHEHLLGFELETPTPRSRGAGHAVDITGWVVGRSDVASIEIRYRDEVLRVAPVSGARPDVAEVFPDLPDDTNCRFSTSVGLLGLALECELSLTVVLGDMTMVPVGSIRLRRRPVRPAFEPQLQPLITTSLGRSGSTWMMRMLAAHPEVVVSDEHPYEDTYALYWLHMLRVLVEPTNRLQSTNHAFKESLWSIGHNPFSCNVMDPVLRDWFSRTYVERFAAFCQGTIEDWYKTIAWRRSDVAGVTDPVAPALFAEKVGPSPVYQDLVWELYPKAKELFLVRDFRDMVCSILAFDEARGFFGFGRQEDWSDEEYIRTMRGPVLTLLSGWQSRRGRAHLVRYEDLVLRPRETIRTVLEYLEVSSSEADIDALMAAGAGLDTSGGAVPAPQMHRTTPHALASVGRWRFDLDPSLQACCQETFGDVLEQFGYPEAGFVPEGHTGSLMGELDGSA